MRKRFYENRRQYRNKVDLRQAILNVSLGITSEKIQKLTCFMDQ